MEEGQGQLLHVTVQVVTQPSDNALADMIHEISLAKIAHPPRQVEKEDPPGEELQHFYVFLEKDLVEHRFYNKRCCSSQRSNCDHAQHGYEQTQPLFSHQPQNPPGYLYHVCFALFLHTYHLRDRSIVPIHTWGNWVSFQFIMETRSHLKIPDQVRGQGVPRI